jgi:hypothetical protein
MFILLLLVIGIPVLSAVFAIGGVGPWERGIVAFTTVVILGTVSAISLYWSSTFRRSVYLNPLFFLTMALVPKNQLYPEWFKCLGAFVAVALLCAGLTLRNLRRRGDIG